MQTVKQVSRLTGVSVRTLHHYDAIGLLKPTEITEAGYRLYDDAAIARLRSILLFRELQFPLKEIKEILDSPGFSPREALEQQIALLELQQQRLSRVILYAREILEKGVSEMGFKAFDKTEIEQYAAEARQRWGDTAAYREYEQRKAKPSDRMADRLMSIFAELGQLAHLSPEAQPVQQKISELQGFITENCYTCTNEVLAGLGELYTTDTRFRENIDRAGGEGTADFAGKAIAFYCRAK